MTGSLLENLQWDTASKSDNTAPTPCSMFADRIKNGSLTTALVINEPMRLSWGNLNWQIRRVFGEKRDHHTEPSAVAVLGHPQNNQTGEAEPGRNRTLPDSLQGSWRKRPPALCCPTGCWINYSSPSYTVYEMVNCGPGEDPAWGWFVLILSEGLVTQA